MEEIVAAKLQSSAGHFQPLVYWYLSFRCNLACKHCWVNSSPTTDTSLDLQTEDVLQTVARLREIDPSIVILTGGEPLFRRDITSIMRAIVDNGIPLSVETNAMMIRDEHVDLFRHALDRGTYCWISVSLDGGTAAAHEWVRGKRTFGATLRGLRRLKNGNVPFGVQCVVNKKNLSSIPDLFDVASDLGMGPADNLLSFVIVSPVGRGKDSSSELSLTYEEYMEAFERIIDGLPTFEGAVLVKVPPAAIPVRYLAPLMRNPKVRFMSSCSFPLLGILPDGTLSVCALTGKDGTLSLGDLRHDSLVDVVRTRVEPLRANYESATLTGICADCVFRSTCKGGCRAFAYSETGSFIGPYPVCDALEKAGLFPDIYRSSYRETLLKASGVACEAG